MIRLRVLGEVELLSERGQPLAEVVRQPKRLALLVYLLCGPRRFHRRDSLLALFWPDQDGRHARAALRRALFFLRGHLGSAVIESRGDEIAASAAQVWCDAVAFDEAMAAGRHADALALHRGDLLEGVFVTSAPEVERWLDDERARRRRVAAEGAVALARAAEAGGDAPAAMRWAAKAAELGGDEDTLALHLQLLARLDRRDEAVAVYRRYADRLAADLGLEPSPGLRGLADALREAPARPPAGDGEGGEHLIAVLPFTVRGAPELEYLEDGLVDLLSAKLDAAAGLRTVDPHALLQRVRAQGRRGDPESARLVAGAFGARSFVLGSVVVAGDRLYASATLYGAPGGDVRAYVECPREAQPYGFVDELARQLLVGRAAVGGGTVRTLAALTTDSLPALKAFLAGRDARRRGRYDVARDAYARAVRADPAFALGHLRLAGMYAACAQPVEARAASAAAEHHRQRLAERDRLLHEAQAAWFAGDAATAEVLYSRIIGECPEDVEAWFQLGDVQFDFNPYRGHSCTEARTAFERTLELDGEHVAAMIHLARIEALERRVDRLHDLARRIEALSPGSDQALAARAMAVFHGSDRAAQARFLALLAGRNLRTIARVAADVVQYAAGAEALSWIASAALRLAPAGTLGGLEHVLAAHLAAAGGDWAGVARGLEPSSAADEPLMLLHSALLALLPSRAADRAALIAVRERLEAWRAGPPSPRPNLVLSLLDEVQGLLRQYLVGLAHAWLAERGLANAAAAACVAFEPPASAPLLPRQLAAGIRARLALQEGDAGGALQALEGLRFPGWPELVIWSPFHGYAAERLARAQACAALNRAAEARAWAEGLAQRSPCELAFRAEARRLGLASPPTPAPPG